MRVRPLSDIWSLPELCGWCAAVVVGIGVRIAGLWNQILVADEIHTFHAALNFEFPEILWRYRLADHCIPITAYLRAWILSGIQPSELTLRIPLALLGIALLLIAPVWAARRVGPRTGIVLGWMIALSPVLVFYSRLIRPYIVVALLGALALGLFVEWWEKGKAAAGALYGITIVTTIYFHLVSAPFVVAPLLLASWDTLRTRPFSAAKTKRLATFVLTLAAVLATYLAFAWPTLSTLLGAKAQSAAVGLRAWRGAAFLVSGSESIVSTLCFWSLVIWGSVELFRRHHRLVALLILAVGCQLIAVLIVAPFGASSPAIFMRYNAASMIPLLLMFSVGLARLSRTGATRRAGLFASVTVLLLFAPSNPLRDPKLYQSPLGFSPSFLVYALDEPIKTPALPAAYLWLENQPSGAIIEGPTQLSGTYFLSPLASWQRQHGRTMRVIPRDPGLQDDRLGLRNTLRFDLPELRSSSASYLILHRNLSLGLSKDRVNPRLEERRRKRVSVLGKLGDRQIRLATAAWGPADFSDRDIAIWNLQRLHADGIED